MRMSRFRSQLSRLNAALAKRVLSELPHRPCSDATLLRAVRNCAQTGQGRLTVALYEGYRDTQTLPLKPELAAQLAEGAPPVAALVALDEVAVALVGGAARHAAADRVGERLVDVDSDGVLLGVRDELGERHGRGYPRSWGCNWGGVVLRLVEGVRFCSKLALVCRGGTHPLRLRLRRRQGARPARTSSPSSAGVLQLDIQLEKWFHL